MGYQNGERSDDIKTLLVDIDADLSDLNWEISVNLDPTPEQERLSKAIGFIRDSYRELCKKLHDKNETSSADPS